MINVSKNNKLCLSDFNFRNFFCFKNTQYLIERYQNMISPANGDRCMLIPCGDTDFCYLYKNLYFCLKKNRKLYISDYYLILILVLETFFL